MASIFDQARQLADRLKRGAVSAVRPPIASPIPRYTNPTQTLSYKANEVKRAVLQPVKQAANTYLNTYQKVSPYVPFAPKIQTPQTIQQNYNTFAKPVASTIMKQPIMSMIPGGQTTSNLYAQAKMPQPTLSNIFTNDLSPVKLYDTKTKQVLPNSPLWKLPKDKDIGTKKYIDQSMEFADAINVGGLLAGPEALGYRQTGSFSSLADRKPRFEIPDNKAVLKKGKALVASYQGAEVKLGQIFQHDELYRNYPQLKDISVKRENLGVGTNGMYDAKTNTIYLNDAVDYLDDRSTLLHEVQHIIQKIEGFARGGSPEQFDDLSKNENIKELFNKQWEYVSKLPKDSPQWKSANEELQKLSKMLDTPHKQYQRLAGEIEARAVQQRQKFTPAQRKALDPYAGQGIPLKDQIVSFGNEGSSSVKQTIPSEVGGKTYKIIKQEGIREVQGTPVKIVDGIDTFIHEGTDGWVVSEASTGRYIADSVSKEGAISKAKSNINQVGEDKFRKLISDHPISSQPNVKPDLTDPNYTPITLKDGKVQKLDPKENIKQLLNPATMKGESIAEARGRIIGGVSSSKSSGAGVQPNLIATSIKPSAGGSQPPSGNPPNILASQIQTPEVNPSSNGSVTDFDPFAYIKEQMTKRDQARGESPIGSSFIEKGKSLLKEIKEKIVDSTSPIEDVLSTAEKKYKFKVLPSQDIRLQIDRVLRSKSIASQFAEDNGFVDVIRQSPDLDALNQYMIAKHAQTVEKKGIKTGRDLVKDQQLIQALSPQYEQQARQVTEYSRKLLSYAVNAGLIDKDLATQLIREYPDYVPLKRVFSVLEEVNNPLTPKGVASVGRQTIVQKLKGSEREIENPIESLLLKTEETIHQAERNVAARQLASYSKLPGFEGLLRELKPNENAVHTISYIDNGVKRTYATTKEIEDAAKSLNVESIGLLGKIVSVPTRILQAGATSLNVPFVVTNMLKDQITSFVNSNRSASTSILNPVNFIHALYESLGHGKVYREMVSNAAGGTSFDIARQAPELTIERLRAGRNLQSKIAYTVKHPTELLKAVEDIIGRSEELGRIQNYRGMKQQLLKEGRTEQDATLLAAQAGRENTANFARKGTWGKVLNVTIPFFNAGIQGARQLVRSFQNNPKGTSVKVATSLFTPIAVATMWNTSDPARKQIYDDIDAFEKENNIILIPDGATKDNQGRWNVIKIPLPPGLSNLTALIRRPLEQSAGLDPVTVQEMLANALTASTSIDVTSPSKLLSSVTPQGLKVPLEAYLNKNLFTGKDIVPRSMQNLPKTEQARPNTSGTMRFLGNATNTSPLILENMVRTGTGGVGTQLMNASDQLLAKTGIIPKEQIGGETIGGNLERRFKKASGGRIEDRQFQELQPLKEQGEVESLKKKQAIDSIKTGLKSKNPEARKQYLIEGVRSGKINEEILKGLVASIKEDSLQRTYFEKSLISLPVRTRARYVMQNIEGKSSQEKKDFLINLYKKKIITNAVLQEMAASRTR